jgi:hypothetical protein
MGNFKSGHFTKRYQLIKKYEWKIFRHVRTGDGLYGSMSPLAVAYHALATLSLKKTCFR